MDFFGQQDTARKRTAFFVFHFTMGLITVVFTMVLLASMIVTALMFVGFVSPAWVAAKGNFLLAGVALVTAAAIILASLLKIESLKSSGGQGIATMLGGAVIPPNTSDPNERKLLNVVEEMAIAAGLPVPPVFLLRAEEGINAFAAGYEPSLAVLGVTRGAIQHLTRDELQAVVGHEFSHVLNGDMRLNIRLIGFIHGITVIGLTGQFLFFASMGTGRRYSLSTRDSDIFLPGILLGLVLMAIGYGGTFFGNLIKAAVSREREYLADASSVQFTRNPQAVVTALEKIGGYRHGSLITSPRAAMVSHMFFHKGMTSFLARLMATHPSLPKRIRRINPTWTGEFPEVDDAVRRQVLSQARMEAASFAQAPGSAGAPPPGGNGGGGTVVEPRAHSAYLRHARALLKAIPAPLAEAGRKPHMARPAVYAMLLARITADRQAAMDKLLEILPLPEYDAAIDLVPHAERLTEETLLPFIDICMPTLSTMAPREYELFASAVDSLIRSDSRTDFIEWTLQQAMMRRLHKAFAATGGNGSPIPLGSLRQELLTLLSCVAHLGKHAGTMARDTDESFAKGAGMAGLDAEAPLPPGQCSLNLAHRSLGRLARAWEADRQLVLDACAAVMLHDEEVTPKEALFLRAVAGALDTPCLPLLPGQHVD